MLYLRTCHAGFDFNPYSIFTEYLPPTSSCYLEKPDLMSSHLYKYSYRGNNKLYYWKNWCQCVWNWFSEGYWEDLPQNVIVNSIVDPSNKWTVAVWEEYYLLL